MVCCPRKEVMRKRWETARTERQKTRRGQRFQTQVLGGDGSDAYGKRKRKGEYTVSIDSDMGTACNLIHTQTVSHVIFSGAEL